MDITIHSSTLPHDDPEASLVFWRDVLGFQVPNDVGEGQMRWIRVGPPGQPDTSMFLTPLCNAGFGTTAEGNLHIERWNGCLEHLVEHLGSRSAPA
jgi:hypothetical protein